MRSASVPEKKSSSSFLPPLWVLTVFVLALLGWVLYELKEMVILVVVGFSISYIISPILSWLEERGVGRPVGVFLVGVVALLLFAGALVTTIPTLIREYGELAKNFPEYLASVREQLTPLFAKIYRYLPEHWVAAINTGSISEVLSFNGDLPQRVAKGLWSTLLKGYDFTLALVNFLLLPFLVYYLSVDYHRLYKGLLSWFPGRRRDIVDKILTEVDTQVAAYIRGQLLVGFVLFCCYAIGLGLLQVELWFLVAFISGFGNLIPYVGTIVGVCLSTIMALVTAGGGFTLVLLVWGLYALVQFFEGTFITPKIIGDSLGLSPLMVILAILAGGSLFGLLGVFLAVPTVAALQVIIRHLHAWAIQQVGS